MSLTKARSRTLCIVFAAACLTIAACSPRIYSFTVDPRTIGQNDTVHVQWAAKGQVFLRIQDYVHPVPGGGNISPGGGNNGIGAGGGKLADLTLLLTRDGQTTPILLRANSGIQLSLPSRDSLSILKQPDSNSANILRYFALAAKIQGKETDSIIQIEIRTDSATDQIAFAPILFGDSLIATGINDTVRWGNTFTILTVAAGGNRLLTVTHAGITSIMDPAQKPDDSFKGTPVKGEWTLSSPLNQDEKDDHSLFPHYLKVTITIKHR